MFCYKCGTQLPDGAIFCAGCGAAQQGSHQASVSPGQGYDAPGNNLPQAEQAYAQPGAGLPPAEQAYAPPGAGIPPEGQMYAQPGAGLPPAEQAYAHPAPVYAAPMGDNAGQHGSPERPTHTHSYTQSGSSGGAAARKKSGLWLKIAIPVFVVALAAAGIYYFVFMRSTANIVTKALANTGEEISQRIDGTPLKAIGMLSDILKDGSLTVDFDRSNERYGAQTSGSIKLSSNSEEREFAIAGEIKLYDDYFDEHRSVDFEAYINKERLAIGSRLFNDKYYGIRYSTFGDDFKIFGDAMDLDSEVMEQIVNIVDMIDNVMNYSASDNTVSEANESLNNLLIEFYEGCEQTSGRAEIDIGGKTVRVTQYDITITKDAILGLLEGYYSLLEDNEDGRALMDLYLGSFTAGQYNYDQMSYSRVLREIRNYIRDFEKYYSDTSTITLSLYIGNDDRLILIEVDANLRVDDERHRFSISLDFGDSAADRWVFKITANGDTIRVAWDYKERSSSLENTITISTGENTITLISDWSPGRGDFTLSFEYEESYGWSNTGEITGTFREDSNGFSLSFDNLMDAYYGDSFTISITAEKGADIKQIEYIKIDKWDIELIEDLGEFLQNTMG